MSDTSSLDTAVPPEAAAQPKLHSSWGYSLLALVSLGYLGLTLWSPIDPNTLRTYALSALATHLLQLTVTIPVVAIWFIALWGSLRFKRYALGIYHNPDGKALNIVSNGLLTLVGSLAVGSLLQALIPLMTAHGHGIGWTIITHHATLVLSLAAFAVMFAGALRLAQLVQLRGFRRWQWLVLLVAAIMGVVYALVLIHDPYRTQTANPTQHPSYYLSDPWILGTVLLPYVVAWYLGLMAAMCLRLYQAYSPGIIYRRALSRLSLGLLVIIGSSVLIQLLSTAASSLTRLGLNSVLLLLYGLIIVYAFGHVLVVIGARQLSKIEEVG